MKLICFLIAVSVQAAPQPTLDEALTAAITSWGATAQGAVSIQFYPLNDCDRFRDGVEIGDTKITTTVFNNAPSVTSYVIQINSRCDWTRRPLQNVVLHEYGHVLLGDAHSKDPHSVMFWLVHSNKQRITAEDRARLAVVLLRRAAAEMGDLQDAVRGAVGSR